MEFIYVSFLYPQVIPVLIVSPNPLSTNYSEKFMTGNSFWILNYLHMFKYDPVTLTDSFVKKKESNILCSADEQHLLFGAGSK